MSSESADDKVNITGSNSYLITEADGSFAELWAFKSSVLKSVTKWISYILTIFILRLVFHWYPQWHIRFSNVACSFKEAEIFLIRDTSGLFYIIQVHKISKNDGIGCDLNSTFSSTVSVSSHYNSEDFQGSIENGEYNSWFYYKNIKYISGEKSNTYSILRSWDEQPVNKILEANPLDEDEVSRRRNIYDENDIDVPLRSIPKLLLTEGLNPFYVFQVASCILWFADEYYYYASAIVLISCFSLSWQLYDTRKNERKLCNTVNVYGTVTVHRLVDEKSEFISVKSSALVPGDVIEVPRDGCMMFCDAVLLKGNCIVNESTLTGESVPVTKIPFSAMSIQVKDVHPQFDLKAESKSVLFCGTQVIQTRNYADQKVLAVVLRTGFRTAKGEMVRAILFPKPMKFMFTRDVQKFVGALSILAIGGFCFSVYLLLRNGEETGMIVKRALDLITIAVPPALPVAMTVGIAFAQGRLKKCNIFCMSASVINVCGVINVACFDKTGTITEDGLDLWGVIPNGDGEFLEPVAKPESLPAGPLVETMATCHSLTRIGGELSGDPLDLKMFLSTNWELTEEVSEDHCKYEMTIPAVVRPRIVPFVSESTTTLANNSETLPYEIGIIRQFPFSSTLQRMSVIARALNGSHFNVYTKGSPEMIETLCRFDTLPRDFHSVLLEYTREGYRVIALAWRPLRVAYTKVMRLQRENIERQLHFLGLLVMENRLKPESAPIINTLREAHIRPVMVTGDNMLTALSVARDCEMIDEMDRIIIVSAKSPKAQLAEDTKLEDDFAEIGNEANSAELWKDLVQFHYAEDLHRPVTEVQTASKIRRTQTAHHQNNVSVHEVDAGIEMPQPSKLAKWLPFLRKRSLSNYASITFDVESGANVSDGHADAGDVTHQEHTLKGRKHLFRNPATNKLTLRMVDRPDFHLALSGKTWAIIMKHFPSLIPKLVVKGTVFARFSPDQKAQLIEALQSVGYFVAMCGDGANDCGALKAAHAGIALSQSEASVASPFTSGLQNISCVPKLIQEGRCALATSFGTFKFMMGYSLTQFTSVILLYWVKSTLMDMQFLYIDLFIITSLGITFGYTKAYPKLSVEPPVMRLLSTTTLLSLFLQLILVIGTQIGVFLFIRSQTWYVNLVKFNDDFKFANYDLTAIFIVSSFQYIFLAIIFSKGPPYRRSMYTNYFFLTNVILALVANLVLTAYEGQAVLDWISLIRFPSYYIRLSLILAAFINLFLGYLIEIVVDGVAFRRQLKNLKSTLFPRHVARKDYERIREEIDRMAGVWPPIIRSASIQDIRSEFFAEEHHTAGGDDRRLISRGHSRNVSTNSSCLDEGDNDVKFSMSIRQHRSPVCDSYVLKEDTTESTNARKICKKRYRSLSSSRTRRHSMEAAIFCDLLEQSPGPDGHIIARQEKGAFDTIDEQLQPIMVQGKKELRRLKHPYPSRLRSQSSSCDKGKAPPRVVPPHHPGIS